MDVGATVWVRDPAVAWTTGTIAKKTPQRNGTVILRVKKEASDEVIEFTVSEDEVEFDGLKLMNELGKSNVDNLVLLPYLHEPAILHSLHLRFIEENIYTYTGPILIAVNPFKSLEFYDSQTLEAYYNFGISKAQGILEHLVVEALPPHIFAIADSAYHAMLRGITESLGKIDISKANQAILISGESGAGKTESTKLILRYLTTISVETREFKEAGSVMDKVLQSNPILEAFGNARTLRNDNSSRFGKFIELKFNRKGHLIGGNLETYLLEKVRLISHQGGERNYHIFYQMAAGGSAEDKKRWGYSTAASFHYVNQGKTFTLQFIDDKVEFNSMLKALDTLNFKKTDRVSLLNFMAAILHLGQLQFTKNDKDEGSSVASAKDSQASINLAATLLGVTPVALSRAMTVRVSKTNLDTFEKLLDVQKAGDARDALAKAIYSRLFTLMVQQINSEIKAGDPMDVDADIGVLDIFGFECFQNNSFEQLCINYTNETLQQQFNKYVFELEQVEYKEEGIEWSFVEFPNNQDCLDLIDMKTTGLFALLDDECLVPKGADGGFAKKLYNSFSESPRFSASNTQKTQCKFAINHYAGPVIYDSAGFLDKNKDEVPNEVGELFGSSNVSLLVLCADMSSFVGASSGTDSPTRLSESTHSLSESSHHSTRRLGKGPSVCSQFKRQLYVLMEKIYQAEPHFVRCIKPNDVNRPDTFSPLRVTEQLRCGGVLEAVRVSRSGFPYRMPHIDFYNRYRPLINPFHAMARRLPVISPPGELKKNCAALLSLLWDDGTLPGPSSNPAETKKNLRKMAFMQKWKGNVSSSRFETASIQIGKTKVFLRKQPHDFLEGRRSRLSHFSAIRVRALWKGFFARKYVQEIRAARAKIQRSFRKCLFRKQFALRVHRRRAVKEREKQEKLKKEEMERQNVLLKEAHKELLRKKKEKEQADLNREKRASQTMSIEIIDTEEGPGVLRTNSQVMTLFQKTLSQDVQDLYEKQFPKLYTDELLLNMFGSDKKAIESNKAADEKTATKWMAKGPAEGGISEIVKKDLLASKKLTWREKLFGNGLLFSKNKSSNMKPKRIVKRTVFAEEMMYQGSGSYHAKGFRSSI